MAQSYSHKFGQMLGNILEYIIITELKPVTSKYNMYLDYKHQRKSRNNKKEVIWKDINENSHKLDIVIEQNGTEDIIGNPKAFIEMAWRRYTKHSKNKAQEISGALIPLAEKYSEFSPFLGVVLAGEFTAPSIIQLRSQGFEVLYFKLDLILNGLAKNDLIVNWNESTPEKEFEEYVSKLASWGRGELFKFKNYLLEQLASEIEEFKASLTRSFTRTIEKIRIVTLHAEAHETFSIDDAVEYLMLSDESKILGGSFLKFEIYIRYSNNDKLELEFHNKIDAISFLRKIV